MSVDYRLITRESIVDLFGEMTTFSGNSTWIVNVWPLNSEIFQETNFGISE